MRRYFSFLLIVFVVLTLVACEVRYYSVLIANNSSKNVSYEYNGSPDTLDSDKSKTYQVKAYTHPPKNISVTGAMSVKMETRLSGEEYAFVNAAALDLHVLNTLDVELTLMADNYIDNSGETSLTIPANTEIKTAKIYTTTPHFTITSGYSPAITWKIEDNVMYVTIK
jgi:hypothetical protein